MSNILNRVFRNNISAILTAGINASATSLTVQTDQGAGFALESGQHIRATLAQGSTIEIIDVTARSGDTLTIQRGQEGTTPAAFTAGASVSIRWTADTIDAIVGILAGLNPVFPGSVWYDGLWIHEIRVDSNGVSVSHLDPDTSSPDYVADAFKLVVGDYFEIRVNKQLQGANDSKMTATILVGDGPSIKNKSISQSTPGDFTETQDGTDYIYRYTITESDLSGESYVFLYQIRATCRSWTGAATWTLKDISTSRGSLQSGVSSSAQAMSSGTCPQS